MAKKRNLQLRVEDSFVDMADRVAQELNMNRSQLVRQAILEYIQEQFDQNKHLKEILVDDYLAGDVSFEDLKRVIGEDSARGIRASKLAYEESEETVAEIAKDL